MIATSLNHISSQAPRTNRIAIRPAPVGSVLTRAELVAGLRRAFQQAQLDLLSQPEDDDSCALIITSTLRDVTYQFGLNAGEMEEIFGQVMIESLTSQRLTQRGKR
jgi:hypothetical protein